MKRLESLLAAGVLALGSLTAMAGPAAADHSANLRNCSDFRYYEDALEYLQRHPGDPDRLDDDSDGKPCERLPKRPVSALAPAPAPVVAAPAPCVYGAIGQRYAALGGAAGPLGRPLTCELPTPRKPGRYNHFEGGSIYWSAPTGAWEVRGRIRDTWAALGWENSHLGFPTTGENPLAGGAFSRFQGGQIYWSPQTDAHEVRGSIFAAWGRTGWENGVLGYPRTDELPTPTKPGRYNHFEGGSIYWSPSTGAFPLEGPILQLWSGLGWENSALGFPTSVPYYVPGTGGVTWTRQDFQGGVITSSPTAGTVVGLDPGGDGGGPADGTAAALLAQLRVAPETPGGFAASLFPHWADADGDGCDTREEVLIVESQVPPTVSQPGCEVTAGQWPSFYDSSTWTSAADVTVDHVVALREAWESGASAWTTSRRRAFANDLGYAGSLETVLASVDRAKGDSDPAQWLPPHEPSRCRYAVTWVAVKWRWDLSVDAAERDRLAQLLSGPCGSERVQTSRA